MTLRVDTVLRLQNPIQHYAWGSRGAIAELCNRPAPSPEPEAELWMGAHPKAPSRVTGNGEAVPLDAVIAGDPDAVLGPRVARRFGGRLPFLFKVLAAAEPLSIQAHPDRDQARRGFERENRAGIPLDAGHRNYRDANHKPEIICALTDFWGLNGFRAMDDLRRQLKRFCPDAAGALLAGGASAAPGQDLERLFDRLLGMEGREKDTIVDEAVGRARGCSAADPIGRWIVALQEAYPGDIGVLAPIVLNLVHLKPGQAMYLPARQLHAYLKGVGIELMANSDNVLRGGLTPKHIDRAELMQVLQFAPAAPGIVAAKPRSATETLFPTPADEFVLARIDLTPGETHEAHQDRTVEILLVTEGEATLGGPRQRPLQVKRGESVLIPAAAGAYRLAGRAVCYKAGVPTPCA